jgi:hypothetical protein
MPKIQQTIRTVRKELKVQKAFNRKASDDRPNEPRHFMVHIFSGLYPRYYNW